MRHASPCGPGVGTRFREESRGPGRRPEVLRDGVFGERHVLGDLAGETAVATALARALYRPVPAAMDLEGRVDRLGASTPAPRRSARPSRTTWTTTPTAGEPYARPVNSHCPCGTR
ncbi:hypothetical protein FHS32_005436 [Streptomyces albaduncus]|uniref:Uncharacterized protein n=1 Tax=Streptomyces griseoloalbus TaxID=67303 RepID=A0A7W8FBT7_9ACTN|nr:hypothetical protein [Streptomyces albaduncus]GGW46974.1 hypothetical protein GCM10010340_26410 [Streptomyces albaduncus]